MFAEKLDGRISLELSEPVLPGWVGLEFTLQAMQGGTSKDNGRFKKSLELGMLFRGALLSEGQKKLSSGNGGAFVCSTHLNTPNE
jgi:hypothetical protein